MTYLSDSSGYEVINYWCFRGCYSWFGSGRCHGCAPRNSKILEGISQ